MRNIINNKELISLLVRCQKEYDENLKNKKIMFIIEQKDRTICKEEVYFGKKNFYHLTGIIALDKQNKELSPSNFYYLLSRGRIDEVKIKRRDDTTDLKLQILPQIMRIDRIANMIGDYSGNNIFLQTEKIAGNVTACIGFVRDGKLDTFVPNMALNIDIRTITNNRSKIIAILKKEIKDNLYKDITYLKSNYEIEDILKSEEVNKNIDIDNIYSYNKLVDKKIYNFYYSYAQKN